MSAVLVAPELVLATATYVAEFPSSLEAAHVVAGSAANMVPPAKAEISMAFASLFSGCGQQ